MAHSLWVLSILASLCLSASAGLCKDDSDVTSLLQVESLVNTRNSEAEFDDEESLDEVDDSMKIEVDDDLTDVMEQLNDAKGDLQSFRSGAATAVPNAVLDVEHQVDMARGSLMSLSGENSEDRRGDLQEVVEQ